MTTFLIIAFLIICVFVYLWFYRDRLYLKKDIKEVVSDDMRKELNLRTQDTEAFEKRFEVISQKKQPSRDIANEWDEITE